MAQKQLVLQWPEDRTVWLWLAKTRTNVLDFLKFAYLPDRHNLNLGIRVEISQHYRISQPAGNYNFVVQYMLPDEQRFWPRLRYATFWLDEVEVPEVLEGHTLPVSLGSLIVS